MLVAMFDATSLLLDTYLMIESLYAYHILCLCISHEATIIKKEKLVWIDVQRNQLLCGNPLFSSWCMENHVLHVQIMSQIV